VKANSAVVPSPYPDATSSLDALIAASESALSVDELLPALAHCWREQLAAGLAVVAIRRVAFDHIDAFRADPSGATRVVVPSGLSDPPEDEGLRQPLIDTVKAGEPEQWIPLGDAGPVIGGVLLYSDQGRALMPAPPAWVTTTARLLARAREYETRLRDDKLEAMAEFAAGAGHEINNPLGSIIISTQTLLKGESDPERRRLLARIGAEAYRARDMISDAMTFARPPQPKPQDLDLSEQIEEVLSRFSELIDQRHITIETDLSRPTAIHADPTQLAVVISELLRNALNAVDEGGSVRITCHAAADSADALLTLTDNGRGLNDEQRAYLFDPFYSGRQAGRGLGFGLPKAWRIITGHGGRIVVTENEPRGLTFEIRWPGRAPSA
jgi:signal transduction histidine kinase